MKKLLFLLIMLVFITGCTSGKLNPVFGGFIPIHTELLNPQGEKFQSPDHEELEKARLKREEETKRYIELAEQEIKEKKQAEELAKEEVARQQEEKIRQENVSSPEEQSKSDAMKEKVLKTCKGTIYDFGTLMNENPYDINGKCYETVPWGYHIQILTRTTALLIYPDLKQTIYINFGKISTPTSGFRTFVVIGNSKPFQYRAISGEMITAFSVRWLAELHQQ